MKTSLSYPGDSLKINFQIKNTYDYSIDFNHRQFPVKICVVLIGKKMKEMNILDVSLSKPMAILYGGQVIQRSLTTVIPELQNGQYKLGICLKNAFGPAFNSNFSEIRITGEN